MECKQHGSKGHGKKGIFTQIVQQIAFLENQYLSDSLLGKGREIKEEREGGGNGEKSEERAFQQRDQADFASRQVANALRTPD